MIDVGIGKLEGGWAKISVGRQTHRMLHQLAGRQSIAAYLHDLCVRELAEGGGRPGSGNELSKSELTMACRALVMSEDVIFAPTPEERLRRQMEHLKMLDKWEKAENWLEIQMHHQFLLARKEQGEPELYKRIRLEQQEREAQLQAMIARVQAIQAMMPHQDKTTVPEFIRGLIAMAQRLSGPELERWLDNLERELGEFIDRYETEARKGPGQVSQPNNA